MFGRENKNWEDNGNWRRGRGRGFNHAGSYRGGYQIRSMNKRTQPSYMSSEKRMKFEVSNRLKEVDVGITEFMGDHEHFSGIFKERFGDFHVHEISLDGVISKLTDQKAPDEPIIATETELLAADTVAKLLAEFNIINDPESGVTSVDLDVTEMSKKQRRFVHEIARDFIGIGSETNEKDNRKIMTVSRLGKECTRETRVDWLRKGSYCHFLLYKINMDTMDALNQLAMHLRLKPNMFSYAGTKDRRAHTTQWVSIKRVSPRALLWAKRRVHGIYIGNFKFERDPLKLGMLSGNRFTIALRNLSENDEKIEKAMISLRDNGFINYYGLQRFGTVASIPTHEIGKTLLQGKWNEAIDLILKPRPGEFENMAKAREVYAETKDPRAAIKHIFRLDTIEARLLKGIIINGKTNPQGALDAIPRYTRLMYIHAYQSYLWNIVVSRRIREFGRQPIVGDLVYEKPDGKNEAETQDYVPVDDAVDEPKSDDKSPITCDESQIIINSVDGEKSSITGEIIPTKHESDQSTTKTEKTSEVTTETSEENTSPDYFSDDYQKKENNKERKLPPLPAVKILTEDDLKNYTLADVIMPQPGWRVTYPPYAKIWFEEYLANDGLTTELRQKNKKYALGGGYRKILQIPENLTWKIMNYKEIHDELIGDELKNEVEPQNNPEGKYRALILGMSLKPSTYATMALREILVHDTSAETQAAQSAAYHALGDGKLKQNEMEKVSEDVESGMEITNEKKETELLMETELNEISAENENKN